MSLQGICAEAASIKDQLHADNMSKDFYPTYPTPHYTKNATTNALIKKGEYLARIGDCIACHTDPKRKDQPFAGGLGIRTPFGTLYSSNITPDKNTGIGNWTDEEFSKALRHGIAPDGSYFYPVFPFVSFNILKDEDTLALKTYLFSLTPIHQPKKPNGMPFPFNWRFLQLGWRVLFFHPPGSYQEDPQKTEIWNRGAYLVQGLGHCGMCHTPLNILGAEKKKYFLTGGFIDGYYAPNITETGLKNITLSEIKNVFITGQKFHNAGNIGGPMAEVNHDSLQYLNDNDLTAIAVYLKTVKSHQPLSATGGGPITADTGKKIYNKYCATCHTTGAAGAPQLGNTDVWSARLTKGLDPIYQYAINGLNSMPARGTCTGCTDDEIKTTVDYILAHSKPGAATSAHTSILLQQPRLPLGTGKRIYQTHCASCHNVGKEGAPRLDDKLAWKQLAQKNIDTLFINSIKGYHRMPERGGCTTCSNSEIQAALLYMVHEALPEENYSLW